jgi:diketogulonate reductase-like aldo/keto reductase
MKKGFTRRRAIQLMGTTGLSFLSQQASPFFINNTTMLKRPIPSSGEMLPVVGVGTWLQFDVTRSEYKPLLEVLNRMNEKGGKVIDSSPMYGNAETAIGHLTTELNKSDRYFYATKVWINGKKEGINQMESSMQKMRRKSIDLMQVHNLVDWQTHIRTLRDWKEQGRIRYIGITHYTDGAHDNLERIITSEKPDFVQCNYSIRGRHAEKRLLKAAQENGVAVIINQPFESGSLFNAVAGKKLPAWASHLQIENWAQYFLKFLLSHPAVNCVIPGTSDPVHIVENMLAGYGRLPDEKERQKMADYFEDL